jgi:hypothetical protein
MMRAHSRTGPATVPTLRGPHRRVAGRPHHPAPPTRAAVAALVGELRVVLAAAHHLDPVALRARAAESVDAPVSLELLGDAPLRTGADALARLDALARELVARMEDASWDAGAAPGAVTSVLAASVPAAEAALLRLARPPVVRPVGPARPRRPLSRPGAGSR